MVLRERCTPRQRPSSNLRGRSESSSCAAPCSPPRSGSWPSPPAPRPPRNQASPRHRPRRPRSRHHQASLEGQEGPQGEGEDRLDDDHDRVVRQEATRPSRSRLTCVRRPSRRTHHVADMSTNPLRALGSALRVATLALLVLASSAAAQVTQVVSLRGHLQTLRVYGTPGAAADHRVQRRRWLDAPGAARRGIAGVAGLFRDRLRCPRLPRELHHARHDAEPGRRTRGLPHAGGRRVRGALAASPCWSASRKARASRCWQRPTRRRGRRWPAWSPWACPTSTNSAGAGRMPSAISRMRRRPSRRSAPRPSPHDSRLRHWRRSMPRTTSSCHCPKCNASSRRRGNRSACGSCRPPIIASATTSPELDTRLLEALAWVRQQGP